ncbi:MAG: hypothetical protein E6J88_05180, partial [Deltaproteobacteria bacterium]
EVAEKKAAAGASVTVLGTSLGAMAGPDGRFVVEGITTDHGSLLVQADLNGDGTPDRQILMSFTDIHAGLGRNVALGDVSIVENGSIHGRVLRADVLSTTEGQRGTVVFVPQGPYTAYTGDDGSFRLPDLPAGTLSLTFFRDGYDPQGINGVALRPGEDFQVGEVALRPSTAAPQPGAVSGQLSFSPPVADASAATVQAFPLAGNPLAARVSAGGAFSLTAVSPGLYRVEAAFTGYTRAVAANVFVGAGQQVALAISLAKDGVTVSPPDAGPPPSCVAGARCNLPNPCQIGQVNCAAGSPICSSAGNVLDGISCGPNQICSAGACIAVCVGGASCRPPSDPCRQGTVACTGGTPSCVAGSETMADGTFCGHDQVCHAGSCVGCVSGAICDGANPCHSGLTDCSTGTQVCKDSGQALSDTPGTACDPSGFPCHAGANSCATGRAVCTDLGSAKTDGTSCGQNQVCFAGACNSCPSGQDCTPAANPCHLGSIACGTGQPICVDQQVNRGPGASCGSGHVCDGAGGCIACGVGQACTPANPCHAGAIGCSTGAAVCGDLGVSLTDGTGCGAGRYCFQGNCNACSAGATCTPGNPCHLGTVACSTGQAVCSDTGTSLGDGANCGPDHVCFHGAYGACSAGATCTPGGTPDPCQVYGVDCTSGAPICSAVQNQPDGTSCGTSMICRSGSCQTSTLQIVVASGANQQRLLPNQPLPASLVVQVRDFGSGVGQSGKTVTIAPPPGAQAVPASAVTDASGNASFMLTLGRATGDQVFTVGAAAAYPSTTTVTETANTPDPGTMIPLVNAGHALGNSGGGPGPAAAAGYLTGVAVASTGDVYVADSYYCRVYKLSPAGVVTVVAGTTCGLVGDSGPAISAQLSYPHGLALDETNGILYIADLSNQRVRMVQLATGLIDTLAGDSNAPDVPPYGDGGAARSARIGYPASVAVGPERPQPSVYVTDYSHALIRKIDGKFGIITSIVRPGSCATQAVALYDLYSPWEYTASLAFDGEGNLFISGRFCGTQLGTVVSGIARLRRDGSLALVAGSLLGGLGGGSALGARFLGPPVIAFDSATDGGGALKNNLYFTAGMNQVVGRIDGASGQVQILAGTGAAGGAGDFGPATSAALNYPYGLGFAPNGRDLIVADYYNYAVRMITAAGSVSASTATLAISDPTVSVQTSYVDQVPPLPLSVTLTDGSGAPLGGYTVNFSLDPARLPGGWVSNASVQTTLSGGAAVTGRPGLAVGQYGVQASFDDIHGDAIPGSPVSFTMNAIEPANLIFTAVNDAHVYGSSAVTQTGPGTTLTITYPRGVTAASDGTLYFSDNNWRIYRMDPSGIVTRIAGSGGGSYAGDGGPALTAQMQPWGLWLDEPSRQLYFADPGANRIRVIDLGSGLVSLVAGASPSMPPPNNGDGGLAVNAVFVSPSRVAIAGGYLFTGDYSNAGGLRRIRLDPDPANRTVDSLLAQGMTQALQNPPPPATPQCSDSPTFWRCYTEPGCQVAAEPGPSGRLYVSAHFCGKDFNNNGSNYSTVPAIVRVEADNTLTRISGFISGDITDTVHAGDAGFANGYPPMIRFDANGRLWIATGTTVGYFTPSISGSVDVNSVFTKVGIGPPAAPQPAHYDSWTDAFFPAPVDLALLPGSGSTHVVVADSTGSYSSYSLRIIW